MVTWHVTFSQRHLKNKKKSAYYSPRVKIGPTKESHVRLLMQNIIQKAINAKYCSNMSDF